MPHCHFISNKHYTMLLLSVARYNNACGLQTKSMCIYVCGHACRHDKRLVESWALLQQYRNAQTQIFTLAIYIIYMLAAINAMVKLQLATCIPMVLGNLCRN